jgi:hypothetical protein
MGVAAFLGLHHLSQPFGGYWDDNDAELGISRYVADLHDYRGAFIFWDQEEPLFNYIQITFFHLFPNLSSMWVSRISCTLIDLATIWALYLLGKEVAGRRAGVFTAAIGSASKYLLLKVIVGMRIITMPLGVALALLFFFRMIKKPNLKHFLQFGAALALGTYTYSTYRPFVPFFIFITLGWVLFQERIKILSGLERLFLGMNALIILVYFLLTNNFIPASNLLPRLLDISDTFLPCVFLSLLLFLGVVVYPRFALDPAKARFNGWLIGSWFCVLLCFPIMSNHLIINRMRSMESITGASTFISRIGSMSQGRFLTLFWGGEDRLDMSIPGDAYFGYSEVILIALGVAFCLARPKFDRMVLLLAACVGFLPHIVSGGTSSGRAIGCVIPFLLLGALALNRVWEGFAQGRMGGVISKLLGLGLLFFWFWTAQGTMTRTYDQWAEKYLNQNMEIRKVALEDMSQGDRIYFIEGMEAVTSELYEGNSIYRLWDNNVIFLGPNEKPPRNIVIFVRTEFKSMQDKISKEFPLVQWQPLRMPGYQSPTDEPFAWYCSIPYDSTLTAVPKIPKGKPLVPVPSFFETRFVTSPFWIRTFSPVNKGMTFAYVNYQDKTANANDPINPAVNLDQEGAKYQTVIHVTRDGKYDVAWNLDGRTWMRIDDKKIIDESFFTTTNVADPPSKGQTSVYLKAGDHPVEVVTCYQRSHNLPDISFHRKDTPGNGQSIWTGFNL